MPGAAGADALTGRDWISGEEITCRITAEGTTKEDGAVLATVAAVESVQAEPPHLEACLEHVLAMGDGHAIVELNDGVVEVLVHDTVANVGERPIARSRRGAAAKAQQQQARTDSVGVGNSKLGAEVANAGDKRCIRRDPDP